MTDAADGGGGALSAPFLAGRQLVRISLRPARMGAGNKNAVHQYAVHRGGAKFFVDEPTALVLLGSKAAAGDAAWAKALNALAKGQSRASKTTTLPRGGRWGLALAATSPAARVDTASLCSHMDAADEELSVAEYEAAEREAPRHGVASPLAASPLAATPVSATPVSASPVSASPVAAPPLAAPPVAAPPLAAPPVAAPAVAAPPVAATPVSASPVSASPVAAPPLAAPPVAAPPLAAPPVAAPAVAAPPVAAPPVAVSPAAAGDTTALLQAKDNEIDKLMQRIQQLELHRSAAAPSRKKQMHAPRAPLTQVSAQRANCETEQETVFAAVRAVRVRRESLARRHGLRAEVGALSL